MQNSLNPKRYLEGDRTSDLIKEFEIKTNLNSLLKLLPPIQHNDLICLYCGETATQWRAAKNSPAPQPGCIGCKVIYKLILNDPDGAFKIPLPRYIEEVMRPTLEGIVSAKAAKTSRW